MIRFWSEIFFRPGAQICFQLSVTFFLDTQEFLVRSDTVNFPECKGSENLEEISRDRENWEYSSRQSRTKQTRFLSSKSANSSSRSSLFSMSIFFDAGSPGIMAISDGLLIS
jgi:hypothetical protein